MAKLAADDPARLADAPELRDALLAAFAPQSPAAERLALLRQRVMALPESAYAIVPHSDEAYFPLIPGVEIRPLRIDRSAHTQTSLWRLAPGAAIPPHRHNDEEECLILEGSLLWSGTEYRAGDFLLARPGAHHEVFLAPQGALLMIRSELTAPLQRIFERAGM